MELGNYKFNYRLIDPDVVSVHAFASTELATKWTQLLSFFPSAPST